MTTSSPSLDPNQSDVASISDEKPPKTAASNSTSSLKVSHDADPEMESTNANTNGADKSKDDEDAKNVIKALLKEKLDEWTAVVQRTGPLRLLDLPVDVLKEIIKEVTHTNDLTSLALTHSALHNLAIPHIYSRFDIVWPDAHATTDPRTGVDALTYGLATLCMGADVFGRCSCQASGHNYYCMSCGAKYWLETPPQYLSIPTFKGRLGNNYPRWTRKFSLGNGPSDWVQEYMITKESGKMLGTLVALAVARMVNLETFVWDMPTGVLRDVWIALASLQNRKREKGDECRLERVWVRWHDNSESHGANPSTPQPATIPAGTTMTNIGLLIPGTFPTSQAVQAPNGSTPAGIPSISNSSQNRVEYPTLSVLPALKSLSVLDIDELAYMDEMSILIARSQKKLRELRVGLAAKAVQKEFSHPWDGPNLQQVDHDAKWPGASSIGEKRLGGVLGVLFGRVFDIRKKPKRKPKTPSNPSTISPIQPIPSTNTADTTVSQEEALTDSTVHGTNATIENSVSSVLPTDAAAGHAASDARSKANNGRTAADEDSERRGSQTNSDVAEREQLKGQLKLQVLELERVSISVTVLQKAIDWSILSSLTILDCKQHESLWRILRRQFQPQVSPSATLSMSSLIRESISTNTSRGISNVPMEYRLNLKKIHTDCVSSALIAFLKETLAPNSLEVLFLQDRRSQATTVTIDAMFKGPIKRHRSSLQKLLIDSSTKIPRGPNVANENTNWRNWMLNREVLSFITSGRMSNLRELSASIEYKDWHFFLQRLPQIPQLRSLNIPYIADHVTPAYDPKELALQVVDIISLRPEVQLCYMGLSHKCFEILENRSHEEGNSTGDPTPQGANGGLDGTAVDDDDDDDDEEEEGSDEEDDEDNDQQQDDDGTAIGAIDPDETESDLSDHDDSDVDSFVSDENDSRVKLRLREILFYDDKVAIFKARHGRL